MTRKLSPSPNLETCQIPLQIILSFLEIPDILNIELSSKLLKNYIAEIPFFWGKTIQNAPYYAGKIFFAFLFKILLKL
jgi:hypothetical protein